MQISKLMERQNKPAGRSGLNGGNMLFSPADLRRLIIPLLIEQTLAILVGMLDTMMVSSVGEAAISGVSIINEINALMINLLAALATGGAVIVSQYLGADNRDHANLSASQLIMTATGASMILMIICEIANRQIIQMIYGSIDEEVMKASVIYFRITAISFPFLAAYNSCAALYRSMRKTSVTMWVSMLMNIINLAGNYIGIHVLKLGVAGVAWPTLISRAVAAIIMMNLAFNKKNPVYLNWKGIFSWNGGIIKEVLGIAVPNGIENGLFQLGRVMVASIITTYGTTQIAANGVGNNAGSIGMVFCFAINMGTVTVIGQCIGANEYDQARYYMRKLILMNTAFTALANAVIWIFTPQLVGMYKITEEGAEIARTMILWHCIATPLLHPMAFTLPNGLRAAGDAKYTMIVGVLSMFIARIGGSYVLGTLLGLKVLGTYLAMFLDWVVRIVFFYTRYKSNKWTKYRVVKD